MFKSMTKDTRLFSETAIQTLYQNFGKNLRVRDIDSNARPVLILSVLTLCFVCFGFVKISIGVTATGITLDRENTRPVVAPRGGKIEFVISKEDPVDVAAGEVVARISTLDISLLGGGPNQPFQEKQNERQRDLLRDRMFSLNKARRQRREDTERFVSVLRLNIEELQSANQLIAKEVKRLIGDLLRAQENMGRGLILKIRVEQLQSELTSRRLQVAENTSRLRQVESDIVGRLVFQNTADHDTDLALNNIKQQLVDLETRQQNVRDLSEVELRSHADGKLVPRRFAKGQVVEIGEVLFDVVDGASLMTFEADISSRQIGSLSNGLPAKISVDSFPYFEHGFIDGHIVGFSGLPSQAIEPSNDLPSVSTYRVKIAPDPGSLSKFPKTNELLPGMTITVHIQKEQTAIWRLVLAPLIRIDSRLEI